jgi:hypothetical protein
MSAKLSVGLQQKIGQPDSGSLCASCHVEFEIDQSMLDSDLDGFHQQVRHSFAACQQAVAEQLVRQQAAPVSPPINAHYQNGHASSHGAASSHPNGNGYQDSHANGNANGHANGNGNANVNGHANGHANGNGSRSSNGYEQPIGDQHATRKNVVAATQSQVRAIFAIARGQGVNPSQLARERFNVHRLDDLSIREASSLIDELKRLAAEASS